MWYHTARARRGTGTARHRHGVGSTGAARERGDVALAHVEPNQRDTARAGAGRLRPPGGAAHWHLAACARFAPPGAEYNMLQHSTPRGGRSAPAPCDGLATAYDLQHTHGVQPQPPTSPGAPVSTAAPYRVVVAQVALAAAHEQLELPCHVGYRVTRDTMLRGIPCCVG